MNVLDPLLLIPALAPALVMAGTAAVFALRRVQGEAVWKPLRLTLATAFLCALAVPLLWWATGTSATHSLPWLELSPLSMWMAALVQGLGTVIGVFSSRYLRGETQPERYAMAFAAVLAAVHVLLLANHWLLLIGAWATVGVALERLLCFYPERPFARLAAHKKFIADRLADGLLLVAASFAWHEVGSGLLSDLWTHLTSHGPSPALTASAVCLVLAVMLRTALLPVHGWLIQVMEAPTPVSALLHAGVINLGGYVLLRFAPLLEAASAARWLLVILGVLTAVLAGLVMLTRISIKVRLAWSTVAQMGFMVMECGLGLYTLAALHLFGHSLYKAHSFLSASSVVRETRLQIMHGRAATAPLSLLIAPLFCLLLVSLVQQWLAIYAWPWWWSAVLALAWAPLLWLPAKQATDTQVMTRVLAGVGLVMSLTLIALLGHWLPLGVSNMPMSGGGFVALFGMALLYLCLASLAWRPQSLARFRRWSYAGFYVDEFYTRLALRCWPALWVPAAVTVQK